MQLQCWQNLYLRIRAVIATMHLEAIIHLEASSRKAGVAFHYESEVVCHSGAGGNPVF